MTDEGKEGRLISNISSEAAVEIVHLTLRGMELTLRVTGTGAQDAAAFLEALQQESFRSGGRVRLLQMLRSGENLTVFAVPKSDLRAFSRIARRYGLTYCAQMRRTEPDGAKVLVRASDAPRMQRILQQAAERRKEPARPEAEKADANGGRSAYDRIFHPDRTVREINPTRRPNFGRGSTIICGEPGGNPLEIPTIRESLEGRLARLTGTARSLREGQRKGEQTLERGN